MKNFLLSVCLLTCCSLSNNVFAQQPIRFQKGDLIPSVNQRQAFQKEQFTSALYEGKYYLLVQFDKLPTPALRTQLKTAGIELFGFIPGNAYFATLPAAFNFSLVKNYNIASLVNLPAFYKVDAGLQLPSTQTKQDKRALAVSIYGVSKATATSYLQKAGAIITWNKFSTEQIIFIQNNTAVIDKLAALPFVTSIHLQNTGDKALNYNSVGLHGISGLNAANGKNLNGKGIVVGVGDNADISTHIDFAGRLISRSPLTPTDHGTHTSGTVAGAGIINVKNHGMAPRATIIDQYFSDIIGNAGAYVADYDLAVTNNSYYSGEDGCAGEGRYDVLSNYADQQLLNYPSLMHMVASGNDGASSCSPYSAGFATVKSGWQCSKNVLTVGAMRSDDYTIAYFSSKGPVNDGRIKPEIVSNGWAVLSTNAYNTYGYNYGTSMACPAVTGAMALMYERYRQKNGGADPLGSLMKALACNTAEDMGNPGPDYTFGFGMLNARRAVDAIDSNRYFLNSISNGGNSLQTINVPANTHRLKILLYWADAPATINAANALVNDLDLTVTTPGAVVHYPLVLNPATGNVNDVATEAADHLNNIEQVIINNPAAGNYSINVKGTNVVTASQAYVVSYEIEKTAVFMEYPFGGEKLVPGETENIRWNAYDDDINTFTVDYSIDNGANWIVINNGVLPAQRSLAWVVPSTVTNTALVRIHRNNTSLYDQSKNGITILNSPNVTATNLCAGSVQLNWAAITGATSYDIYQLSADTMKVIGNTTALNFAVKGLDKDVQAWLGVAAKNTVAGRRSVSVGIVPGSGPCTASSFNDDLTIDSILEPTTARQNFSDAANATKPVKILIRNTGTVASSAVYNVSYRYGNTTVTEAVNASIPAGGTYTYTFTGMYPIISSGYKYDFKSWVTLSSDQNHLNDTAYKTVKYINNAAITALPIMEDFESMPAATFTAAEKAIADNKFIDFAASTERGRARTFVNSGFAYSGSNALTLDQSPYNEAVNVDTVTFNYNLSNYTSKQLRFDFYYKNHGQADSTGNKIWVRGNENAAWINAYDLYANQPLIGQWKHANIILNDVLANASPAQTVSPTFQIKIGQGGYNSTNNPRPVVDLDDGYTFDDIVLNEALNDVGMLQINSPIISDCALTSANPIGVKIKNYNSVALSNVQVSYKINNATAVTETISLAANQTLDYVFNQKANLAAYIDYNVSVWVKYATDTYSVNDSILNYFVHNSPVVSSYPYMEDFEADSGYFYSRGVNNTWQWGTPINFVINKAANGESCWVTDLTGNYNNNETSYLYSPCYNISGLTNPILSFSHIFSLEKDYDYSWVEYSFDGSTWTKLDIRQDGTNYGLPTNWYDDTILHKWNASNEKWHVASISLPKYGATIRFRFVMSSDPGVTQEGIGIDDIHIFNATDVAIAGTPSTSATATVSGNQWVKFAYGNQVTGPYYIVGEINSNGQNLGSVKIQPYYNSSSPRVSNNQYYLNRNFVITADSIPKNPVSIRLYFSDSDVNSIINATNCADCGKPHDAYELGVTKFAGIAVQQNSLLADDSIGYFNFYDKDSVLIIPNNQGYYAEFNSNGFGEFWLSAVNIKLANSGSCPGETISFVADSGTVYQWQLNDGSGYINLADEGDNYTGTTTQTMQLADLPTSFAGYQYRCIVDGVAGQPITLHFTNVWSGDISTDWFNAANWSCGLVPDQYTDVVIAAGAKNYPVVTANTAIRKIILQNGSLVRLANNVKLEVKGK